MTAVSMLLDHISVAVKYGRADERSVKLMAKLIDRNPAEVSQMLRELEKLGLLEVSAEGMWVVSAGASQNGSSHTGLTKSARTEAAKGSS
jgi:DNA-binding IclR family transcriptional regulator